MRLNQIKLAGFKSFVDATTISVPGQLVAVVGPNGCGKSNVIDAVRWVLGESSAKHLRGETMADVIFNGTSERKPVGRASVELVFDNSLGRAAGQWQQYAEISVKRVLTRDGTSTYHVNNQHVRRRDVQDIFLGTGLGPRAYAIIEQGMISRVIESKPEELRVFLEEAAGVSKYKERRKETENRLQDTRENLARVQDIVNELVNQITKLENQAQVAERYKALQTELSTSQNLIAFAKKRDADNNRDRHGREIEKLTTQLESQTAHLREWESKLEAARQEHYAAGDKLHSVQGDLYAANAEVARVEQELQHLTDTRRRVENQLASIVRQIADIGLQKETASIESAQWKGKLGSAIELAASRLTEVETIRQKLPEHESHYQQFAEKVATAQKELSQAEQEQSVAETRESHAMKAVSQLEQRADKLFHELEALVAPDMDALATHKQTLADLEGKLKQERDALAELEKSLPGLEQQKRGGTTQLQEMLALLAREEAQLHTLQAQQSKLDNNQKLQDWIERHQLGSNARLWQQVGIEKGWEDALEGALGTRLNAIRIAGMERVTALLHEPPPGNVVLFVDGDSNAAPASHPGLKPLMDMVKLQNNGARGFLQEALSQVNIVEDRLQGVALARSLPAGALLVSREGHVFSRHGVIFHGPQSELHGVLARQRDIDVLKTTVPTHLSNVTALKTAQTKVEEQLQQSQQRMQVLRNSVAALQARSHETQMESLKLSQAADQVSSRRARIEAELAEIKKQQQAEEAVLKEAQEKLASGADRIGDLQEKFDNIQKDRRAAENSLNQHRESVQQAERAAQEAKFFESTCRDKIQAFEHLASTVITRLADLATHQNSLQSELSSVHEAPLSQQLQSALARRNECEKALGAVRQEQEGLTQKLREAEEQRVSAEQAHEPLREKITEIRMKEQEARLTAEQFLLQLTENNANLEELAALLEKKKTSALQGEINKLQEDITALGAVNMAALAELEESRKRKEFLDAQSADLNEAVATLEDAIKRIDRETRELLQATFDQVNKNFSEMFPTLFGGGNARLQLTGEEILDAGLQVLAQPPGKKPSSIHLLSGGEKALTAVSLVFALFQLNPAPFCLLDEVDAPLDDANTERFCELVKKMSDQTQFLYISHNKISMEMASQLVGITMQERGVSRVVTVDIDLALKMREEAAA
ncbi:MAG: chromosome segregation protein SMC [Burkholderiales bacterium]